MVGGIDPHVRDDAPDLAPDLRVLDAIASWCGGLHGSMPLPDALKSLAKGFDADAAVISRDTRNDGRCRVAASFDEWADPEFQLHRSFAEEVLGPFYNKVRVSTLWLLSHREANGDFEDSDALRQWKRERGVADIAVIALGAGANQTDYLELHFAEELSRDDELAIEALLPTLVRSWSGRMAGLVTQAQVDERILRARQAAREPLKDADAPILGFSNPAKLSRAEFRVCMLLSRGLSVKGVIDELGLSEATVRSHLRSIYAKTDTSGHADLLYRILSGGQVDPAVAKMRSG